MPLRSGVGEGEKWQFFVRNFVATLLPLFVEFFSGQAGRARGPENEPKQSGLEVRRFSRKSKRASSLTFFAQKLAGFTG